MIAHLRYLRYVLVHKWFVFMGGLRTGVPLWQLIIHDLSKFSRAEWGPYVRRFYGGRGGVEDKAADPPEFAAAWRHHYERNPHHWDHWIHDIDLTRNIDLHLNTGDYVAGVGDGMGYEGYIVDSRTPAGSPPGTYRVRTATDEFWAWDFELLHLVLPMPDRYIREMVADWYGAGMAMGKPDIKGWYTSGKRYRTMHPDTLARAEQLLEAL
jgi:hypothetical protein